LVATSVAGGHLPARPSAGAGVAANAVLMDDEEIPACGVNDPGCDGGGGGGDWWGYDSPDYPDPAIGESFDDGAPIDTSDDASGDYTTDSNDTSDAALESSDPPPPPAACPPGGDGWLPALIQSHEGYSRHVYPDSEGHPTVGVGFNLDRPGAQEALAAVGANYDAVRGGQSLLTDSQISTLLTNDIADNRARASSFVQNFDELSEFRQGVLVDMAFAMGNKLKGFDDMIGAIWLDDFQGAAGEIVNSHFGHTHANRARQDAEFMESCP
jgi:GH24 family phage-related lysozyme (muramidase)